MSFPRYEAYKDSGVEWLGEVPEHWDIKRLKYVAELIDGDRSSSYPSEQDIVDEGIPFLSSKNIIGYSFSNANLRFISHEKFNSLSRGKIKDRDLVITVRGTIGHVAIYEARQIGHQNAFINAQMMIIRPFDISPYLLHSISESDYWKKQLNVASYGAAQQQLSNEVLQNIVLVIPPLTEEEKLTTFLDHETDRIDTLIAEQQRLIELLKEKRQAVISHAVTKGLDPTVPMKDSGVEWLGEVPEHWGITKLKHVVEQYGGSTPFKENFSYWDGDIPWVTPKDMKQEFIGESIDHVSQYAINETNLSVLPKQVVLLVVRGMILAHSIPVAITTVEVTINQDMKALVAKEIQTNYLLLLLQGMKEAIFGFIDNSAHGTKKIEWERFENVSIPLPDKSDQEKIVYEVRRQMKKIDELNAQTNEALKILNERRSALISAAVTGKIDVRDWQAPANASPTYC